MAQLYKNNAAGTLSAQLTSIATTLALTAGHGARFPAPAGSDYFYATLVGLDSNGVEASWEIIKVTARSTDSMTIVRAQDNTTAATWPLGTRVEMRINAATLNGKQDTLASGTNIKTINGVSILGSGDLQVTSAQYQYKNTTAQLVSGGNYLLDSTGEAITATLPATPLAGDAITLTDPVGSWETYNVTIDRNGKSILDQHGVAQAENLVLNQDNLSITLFYNGTNWRLI